MKKIDVDNMAAFCKKKGFVYPSSELYSGVAGVFDYGPNGVYMKNNIKKEWWKSHVQERDDIIGIDGAIITHEDIWKASGHLSSFSDLMLVCSKCKNKERADLFLEEKLGKSFDGLNADEINMFVVQNRLKCPECKNEFQKCVDFNLMFPVILGTEGKGYLRGETAQVIFADFQLAVNNARLKLPFGIAQIGKVFRNEISPRNFLFRCREFEQMEIEYFVNPKVRKCHFLKDVKDLDIYIKSSKMKTHKKMRVEEIVRKKIIKSEWLTYWLAFEFKWFTDLGCNPLNFRIRQHDPKELAHYSTDCWDLEYNFPFGWRELEGIADRSDYDLRQHIKHSGKNLFVIDNGKKIVPHVAAEPSLGVGRAFLIFMFDAYTHDKNRDNAVLRLHPRISPYQAAVFPLVKKLSKEAKKVHNTVKKHFNCVFDESGSLGRRYARMDEIGTPFCIAFDFDSLKDKCVTIRNRDDTKQIRIKIKNLINVLQQLIYEGKIFNDMGDVF